MESHSVFRAAWTAIRTAWTGRPMASLPGLLIIIGSGRPDHSLQAASELKFNRDIRPILADHCFQCHGPDQTTRKAGLRLDTREEALRPAESGARPIDLTEPASSEMLVRIQSQDPALVMPPPEAQKSLAQQQIQVLQQWISDGAEYEPHWAFVPIRRPPLPQVVATHWPRNEIDTFILSGMEKQGLHPSQPADPFILLRRLSLDLTGLPPGARDVAAFEESVSGAPEPDSTGLAAALPPTVWNDWINRMLESPHYGERMAVDWLDAARYADTNGYQVDRDREMYPWRDWVIAAFNANMPFDQFTIEQIAGDLLPSATRDQRLATGFHRNHMLNEEGGVIAEEFLAEYCADRVETTAAVWLGQTFNCARCHDHKFDPFTQRDYYGLYAFFHNVGERGIGSYGSNIRRNAPPQLKLPSPELDAQLTLLRSELAGLERQLQSADSQHAPPAGAPPTPASSAAASSDAPRDVLMKRIDALKKQIDETDLKIPTAMVMDELPEPRVTRILIRGAYDKPGDTVTAGTPASLPPMQTDWPRNRLGLARWLVAPDNPLPARVTVNRLWQAIFGTGLVRTSEDFGIQGELPSHPELLDWLAAEFMESGWDIQHMIRLMVSSATYQQSSAATGAMWQQDPQNRWLARGPRFRLQSEFIRDQALAVSGLLIRRIGGPSVKPWHPAGLYEQVTAGNGTNLYKAGEGEDLFRRSLYTYWKRSVPHPAMLLFDAPFRETCVLRRPRTNTPLQALNLMNDPTCLEAARHVAQRMLTDGGTTTDQRLRWGFRLVLIRPPQPAELALLGSSFEHHLQAFREDTQAIGVLLQSSGSLAPADKDRPAGLDRNDLDRAEMAAMTMVATTLLNLDEAVTKE